MKVYVGSIPALSVVTFIAFSRIEYRELVNHLFIFIAFSPIEYRELVNHLFLKSDWLVQVKVQASMLQHDNEYT